MAFKSADFKRQFPIFSHRENRNLVYLDNAATTQRPQAVIDAMVDFYSRYNANTHRSSHRLARQATAMVENVREQAAQWMGARLASEVVFTRGATEGLNLLAQTLCQPLQPGDEILLSAAEHHANLVSWQLAAQKYGLRLVFLPSVEGKPDLSVLADCVNERTRIFALTGASNALGFSMDLARVRIHLPSNCLFIVDASQLLAHRVVDVTALDCDFLVGSAHKFYGPTGIGVVYGKQSCWDLMPPWQGGGEMISNVTLTESQWSLPPHRFEAGTSSLAAIAGLGACLAFLGQWDRAAMSAYESHLNQYLHQGLQRLAVELPLSLLSDYRQNVGIAALCVDDGWTVYDLAQWLDEQDIAVRVGHHCAQPLVDSVGRGMLLRISLAAYNSREDVDRLLQAITEFPSAEKSMPCFSKDSLPQASKENIADDVHTVDLSKLRKPGPWQARYRQLLQWGELISKKPHLRQKDNQVPGCESEVWLVHWQQADRHRFSIETDSRVIAGLSAVLLSLIDGGTAADIKGVDLAEVLKDLRLERYLTPSRGNGILAIFARARQCCELKSD